jgi:predicted ATP-grasp superfamily ATP-dependent carboligase
MRPWCADLFGDLDLRQHCPVTAIPTAEYPCGFERILSDAPPAPWMYTGAIENRRPLIRRLCKSRPLWGNDSRVLAVVRSPRRVHELLRSSLYFCPEVRSATALPAEGRWLLKPRAGAGGSGIRFWNGLPLRARLAAQYYLQEFVPGLSYSAVYLGNAGKSMLLGITRQLVGLPWLNAKRFAYCGSIGPWTPTSDFQRTLFEGLGGILTSQCGMQGLFGVDVVVGRIGLPRPVEVNPRYSASVEVLEYATGLTALGMHRHVFDPSAPEPRPPSRNGIVGKAIYYAPHKLTFPSDGPWMDTLRNPPPIEEMPAFADIPPAGQVIEAGKPVLTFFVRDTHDLNCEVKLNRIADALDKVITAG